MRQNLYRIDDVLLRTGLMAMRVVLAGIGLASLTSLTDGGSAVDAVARHAALVVLALCAPVVLLGTGFALRRREALEAIRPSQRDDGRELAWNGAGALSLPIFFVLLLLFWPAAIG